MSAFFPVAPRDLQRAGLANAALENLLLKALGVLGSATSRVLAARVGLSASLVNDCLTQLRSRNLVQHRGSGILTGDFAFALSEAGERQRRLASGRSAWAGSAPVPFDEWVDSLGVQSARRTTPSVEGFERALADLEISTAIKRRLGMAVSSGSPLMLYGQPGNGKTSIAERITGAFGGTVFIPRVVDVQGQLVRVFDPSVHVEVDDADLPEGPGPVDRRWACCLRPTVVTGGELSLDMLELRWDPRDGVSEAPPQIKASGGLLLVDDLGRQRVTPTQLLNRWIVPLERAVDYLSLPGGVKVEIPFEALICFSTNLDPADLADEAFLRRIPYKISIPDPSEEGFLRILEEAAANRGLALPATSVEHLMRTVYAERPLRGCHPRDLMAQVSDRIAWLDEERVVTIEALDEAIHNYFLEPA